MFTQWAYYVIIKALRRDYLDKNATHPPRWHLHKFNNTVQLIYLNGLEYPQWHSIRGER